MRTFLRYNNGIRAALAEAIYETPILETSNIPGCVDAAPSDRIVINIE